MKYLRKIPKVYWRALDELDAGNCDGMTYEQVSREMPEEYEARQRDKLRFALGLTQPGLLQTPRLQLNQRGVFGMHLSEP